MRMSPGCLFRCPREEDSFPAQLGRGLSGYEVEKTRKRGRRRIRQDGYDGIRRKCWLGQFGDWGAVVEVVDLW